MVAVYDCAIYAEEFFMDHAQWKNGVQIEENFRFWLKDMFIWDVADLTGFLSRKCKAVCQIIHCNLEPNQQ